MIWRGRLFVKYVVLFVGLVTGVLVVNTTFDLYFAYQENKGSLVNVQREKAEAAAQRIEQFIQEIERQIGWTTHAQWALTPVDQRRFDYVRLLRQVPGITELTQLDGQGKEQLKVSRLAMDVVASGTDHGSQAYFTEALAKRIYVGPVYFRKESEPYMTLALARSGRNAGVTVAEVNLKLIWDVVSQIKVGDSGHAYAVDKLGRLIAHPDISLVLRNTDTNRLPQVRTALETGQPAARTSAAEAIDLQGRPVLSTHAVIPALGWLVFVELPITEARQPVYAAALRSAGLLALGLIIATLAALMLARRLVVPIRAMQVSAQRIGGGDLTHRLEIRTGDELDQLAQQFNRMAGELQQSYEGLERKVEDRTRELRALGEVSQAINSTIDLQTVLSTIVEKAVHLSETDAGAIYVFSKSTQEFRLRATHGMSEMLVAAIREQKIGAGMTSIGEAAARRAPLQVADLRGEPPSPMRDLVLDAGFRSLLIVPLLRPNRIVGALIVRRREPGDFPKRTVDLLQTFAAQSVVAIQNARLFREIEEKGRQLAIASQHKSQFLANMSHELRTPMNAILGYTEMIADGLYGEISDKAKSVLDRVQVNGKHLLGLINDVLDLSKIEAGELKLNLEEYRLSGVVQAVVVATESLARAKNLALRTEVATDLPAGRGDERRLTQVMLNLVGNAIKFTDVGSVTIKAMASGDRFELAVTDTGPGIAPEDQARIFEEFQQVDNTSTRKKGGTGLGLSISRKIVELHGGSIEVQSTPGHGATFRVIVPIRAAHRAEAA